MCCPQSHSISSHKKVASILCAFSMWVSKAEVEEKPNGAEKKKTRSASNNQTGYMGTVKMKNILSIQWLLIGHENGEEATVTQKFPCLRTLLGLIEGPVSF